MTIKVVKESENLKLWRGTATCTRCKAGLEFDVDSVWGSQCNGERRSDPQYWTYGVNCPICCLSNTIDDSTLSEYAKHVIQLKFRPSSGGYFD